MSNLRIIYDNAIDRAVLTASSTAGSLVPANMQVDRKSKVWRASGTSATVTATWASAAQLISGVMLPFCSLTSAATITVRCYSVATGGSPIYTLGPILAAPYTPLGMWSWGTIPLGVNAYSYGNNTYGRIWFDNTYSVKRVEIDISDPTNPLGYIEVGRMVAGSHWSPTYNTAFGIPVTFPDSSVQERTDSGDLVTTIGTRTKKLSFDLNWLVASDRNTFTSLMQHVGVSKPIFVSLFPNDPDASKEQIYQIYGKLPNVSQMSHTMHTIYASQINIEEV